MRVLKTWVNSWATSARYHEPVVLPCLLGRQQARDEQSHCVMCPWLRFIVSKFLANSPMPLVRLGLAQPDSINLLVTACTFSTYHATRNSDLGRRLSNLPNLPFLDLKQQQSAAWIFSVTFLADAKEVKLPCTRYRPQIADLDFELSAGNVISEPLLVGPRRNKKEKCGGSPEPSAARLASSEPFSSLRSSQFGDS